MAHKNERPLKDQTNINEEKFDLRKKAQVAVFMAQKKIKGKKLEEDKRALEFIEKAKTDEELETIEGFIDHHVESEISTAFKNKKKIINGTQE